MASAAEKRAALVAIAISLALAAPAPAGAAPQWRFENPSFGKPSVLTELGRPGDLQFRPGSDNRALLAIGGNAGFPRMGLFTWDGRQWTPLAEVCGADATNARIAWAGQREFWTIAQPSPPRGGSGSLFTGNGLALCHFLDGQVVGSYSRARGDLDPFFPIAAAACAGPDSCWFGGVGAQDPLGVRFGAFHLRWDEGSLTTVYAPQGRSVTDLASFGEGFLESVRVSKGGANPTPPDLVEPEMVPALLHTIDGSAFQNAAWTPNLDRNFDTVPDVPVEGTDLHALDVDGGEAWAVGGGVNVAAQRGPIAARNIGGVWQEVPLSPDAFAPSDMFVDVAAIPGSDDAWVALQPLASTGVNLSTMRATLARISPSGAVLELYTTPGFHGAAAKVDCASPTECWLATYRGVLYHYSDPAVQPPRDVDSAFAEVIVDRPNEAVPQAVPDTPPEDDSELFRPPPIELKPEQPRRVRPGRCRARPPLIQVLDSAVLGRRKLSLEVDIRLRRRARVALVGFSGGRPVGRTPTRTLGRGRHTLRMPVSRSRFPERLRFRTRELTRPSCRSGGA
jgi:hypothetical protein